MVEEMIKIPKSVKESKAAEELDVNVPATEGIKLVSPNGTVYYFTVADDGTLITVEVTA